MKWKTCSLVVAIMIGAAGSRASAETDPPTLGYIDGTWLSACEGEPAERGECNAAETLVRCFQVKNPQEHAVTCNVAMAALISSATSFPRTYTAVAQTKIAAGDVDWLCFSYDELVEAASAPTLRTIFAPKVSCGSGGEPPPCTAEEMPSNGCSETARLLDCESPTGTCRPRDEE